MRNFEKIHPKARNEILKFALERDSEKVLKELLDHSIEFVLAKYFADFVNYEDYKNNRVSIDKKEKKG